jgi:hypothetical protein
MTPTASEMLDLLAEKLKVYWDQYPDKAVLDQDVFTGIPEVDICKRAYANLLGSASTAMIEEMMFGSERK